MKALLIVVFSGYVAIVNAGEKGGNTFGTRGIEALMKRYQKHHRCELSRKVPQNEVCRLVVEELKLRKDNELISRAADPIIASGGLTPDEEKELLLDYQSQCCSGTP